MKTNQVTRRVLEGTPARVLQFLSAVGTSPAIFNALAAAGYSVAEHEEGWRLLRAATDFRHPPPPPPVDDRARLAIEELDGWDEPGFRRISAALGRLHPEQHAFVFDGLEPLNGAGSVLAVATLLDRLDALESDPERVATRDADHAALETLESRGITREERSRLRELVAVAQTIDGVTAEPVAPVEIAAPSFEEHQAKLAVLRAWYDDWSNTARSVLTRRDQRIRVGLAKRKRSDKEEPVQPAQA